MTLSPPPGSWLVWCKFRLDEHSLTYGDSPVGSKRLRKVIANFVTERFHPVTPVTADHVQVTNGLTSALETCAWVLGSEGNGILLGRPYYRAFIEDLGKRALYVLHYEI